MKTIGILTFHFAYNYGAMLQAYALKEYLSKDYLVELINYQPLKTKYIYSTNPFVYGLHPKIILRKVKELPNKKKQARVFEKFKKNYLGVKQKPFHLSETLKRELSQHDINIFGSDQIWNLDITGTSAEYYGLFCDKDKCNVVYAGSFGHDVLKEREIEYLNYLNCFDHISVRESYAKDILETHGINSLHVCDPVLLLDETSWSAIARKPYGISEKGFVLYYTLKEDEKLKRKAKEIANKLGIEVIAIHPNANRIDVGKQLFGVGPREFLWLIQNAEYICTNSFHATAFSLIFHKKLVHLQLEVGKGRVQSLLDIVSAKRCIDRNEIDCIDLSNKNELNLSRYVNKSKEYLATIYEKKENN